MPSVLLVYRRTSDIRRAFEVVADAWRLSDAEAGALAGHDLAAGRPGGVRPSRFVLDRMALAVEIDVLLERVMDRVDVPAWLRRRVPGVFPSSPLEDMFGSTDRLLRIRDMLELEASQ